MEFSLPVNQKRECFEKIWRAKTNVLNSKLKHFLRILQEDCYQISTNKNVFYKFPPSKKCWIIAGDLLNEQRKTTRSIKRSGTLCLYTSSLFYHYTTSCLKLDSFKVLVIRMMPDVAIEFFFQPQLWLKTFSIWSTLHPFGTLLLLLPLLIPLPYLSIPIKLYLIHLLHEVRKINLTRWAHRNRCITSWQSQLKARIAPSFSCLAQLPRLLQLPVGYWMIDWWLLLLFTASNLVPLLSLLKWNLRTRKTRQFGNLKSWLSYRLSPQTSQMSQPSN